MTGVRTHESMIRILLSLLTFPGVIVHEFAHAWACRRLGITVERVCYLRIGNPMGYVLHERPATAMQHLLVATAPFFVSSILALVMSLAACLFSRSQLPPETRDAMAILALWLSFSFALHAFPSHGDIEALGESSHDPAFGLFSRILLVPAVVFLRLVLQGTRCFADVLFALFIVALPPFLLLIMTGGGT